MTGEQILSAIALSMALTVDSFVAGLGLGSQKIKIPAISAFAASAIGTGFLIAALGMGRILAPVLPARGAKIAGFVLLFALGMFKFFESSLKIFLRRQGGARSLRFRVFGIRVLLELYADPRTADRDFSKQLSVGEALGLGVALSLDNFAAGIGAGLGNPPILMVSGLVLLIGMGMLLLGGKIARTAGKRIKGDLSPLGGLLLILLALFRL